MKFVKVTLLFFLLTISSKSTSQEVENAGKFYFNVGPEYRITPIYRPNNLSEKAFYTNADKQNSGIALNLGVNYYITDRLSIGFNNSFRHDLITIGSNFNTGISGVSDTNKGIILDYHFTLYYHFPVFKKADLLLSLGVSFLNRNTEFSITEIVSDDNDEVIGSLTSLVDFGYSANKIAVGYSKGRSKVWLGCYVTTNSGYFEETTTFWVPFVNYSFDFARL